MSKKFAILNGPNLDRLGIRQPDVYGSQTLEDLEKLVAAEAESLGVSVEFFQSNHEGALVDKIALLGDGGIDGVVFNRRHTITPSSSNSPCSPYDMDKIQGGGIPPNILLLETAPPPVIKG